uniref:ATP synthase F0 subunit 8 n=1 Tax=Achatinella mustelina TaxID=115943 RepID=A0A336U878_9EUPU|nr:ATP synthase F0 subunit 8 [Achatinella mustelina]ANC62884.1 ATP synthase F0 subunit 8 [Achatinella mustelina]
MLFYLVKEKVFSSTFCSKIMIKLPQLSPANGLYMFMLLFITFWMILFLIEFKFPMVMYYNSFPIYKEKKSLNCFL